MEIVGDFAAIEPGTDLSGYARQLIRMHGALIGGSRSTLRPRPLVGRSWSRALDAGLAPDHTNARAVLGFDEVEIRRRTSVLADVVGDMRNVISGVGDDSDMLLVVADAEGVVLWRHGSTRIRRQADALGFQEGTRWSEDAVGTNGIGTAITEATPVQLFSAEHFERNQHPWYCTGAPVHDPRTGDLLGIIDISGPALSLHPAVTALVATSARLAETQLWRRHEDRLERLRTSAGPVMAASTGPALVVDDEGWVAHAVGVAPVRRIPVPRTGKAMSVPGLGMCVAEQIVDGWLVRPEAGGLTVRVELALTDPPTVAVQGSGSGWRSAVSVRHAEILVLLHLSGRNGMTVTQVSQALHGDPDHEVTVRAEISRLRRILGSVLASRPYRLADGVELSVSYGDAEGLAGSDFIRRVAGPDVRAFAMAGWPGLPGEM